MSKKWPETTIYSVKDWGAPEVIQADVSVRPKTYLLRRGQHTWQKVIQRNNPKWKESPEEAIAYYIETQEQKIKDARRTIDVAERKIAQAKELMGGHG